jgi:hypothetical protein
MSLLASQGCANVDVNSPQLGMEAKMKEMSVKQPYSRLEALKKNLPPSMTVDQKYVGEFHSILDSLEKESGASLNDFRVPGSELRRRMTTKNTLTGEVSYSESPECDRAFLMMKIDATLGFFTSRAERASIGFNTR